MLSISTRQSQTALSPEVASCCENASALAKILKKAREPEAKVNGDAIMEAIGNLALSMTSETASSDAVASVCVNTGLIPQMVELLTEILASGEAFEGNAGMMHLYLLQVILSLTSCSLKICQSLSQQDKFFKIYYPKLLTSQDPDKMEEEDAVFTAVYYTIGAVFNAYFKNDSEIFTRLSEYGDELVRCAKPFLKCRLTSLSTVALILIAFAVDEKNNGVFEGARSNIAYLINALREALSSPDRKSRGLDAIECAKCIRRLALNDSNKDLLIDLNLLPVVQKMLTSSNDEDVAEGIEILFTLSFSKKAVPRIRKEFSDIVEKLKTNAKWRDSQQLQGLVFQLSEQSARPVSAVKKTPAAPGVSGEAKKTRRVMISYNHGSRAQVERLYHMLIANQLEVWIDFKDMKSGSVYQAMANGIESSGVVLLCISRLYNESNNCRLEVEYAHECGKKMIPLMMEPKYRPEGWLGLLTRAELRYDLTDTKYPFEEKAQELISALLAHFDGASRPTSAAANGEKRGHALPSPIPVLPPIPVGSATITAVHQRPQQSAPTPSKSLRSWDTERVAAWCAENQLPESVRKRGLSGIELQFLVNTLARSPEYFGRVMENHFGSNSLVDLAMFVASLEELIGK